MGMKTDQDYDPAKIVALRIDRGLSSAELARKSGLSQPTIWALEHGVTKKAKADTLLRVAAALGVPLRDIVRPSKRSTADLAEDLLELFDQLEPGNKQAVLAAIKALLHSQK
jgi:transcriptional regulator with XRE-family HTH domain